MSYDTYSTERVGFIVKLIAIFYMVSDYNSLSLVYCYCFITIDMLRWAKIIIIMKMA